MLLEIEEIEANFRSLWISRISAALIPWKFLTADLSINFQKQI